MGRRNTVCVNDDGSIGYVSLELRDGTKVELNVTVQTIAGEGTVVIHTTTGELVSYSVSANEKHLKWRKRK